MKSLIHPSRTTSIAIALICLSTAVSLSDIMNGFAAYKSPSNKLTAYSDSARANLVAASTSNNCDGLGDVDLRPPNGIQNPASVASDAFNDFGMIINAGLSDAPSGEKKFSDSISTADRDTLHIKLDGILDGPIALTNVASVSTSYRTSSAAAAKKNEVIMIKTTPGQPIKVPGSGRMILNGTDLSGMIMYVSNTGIRFANSRNDKPTAQEGYNLYIWGITPDESVSARYQCANDTHQRKKLPEMRVGSILGKANGDFIYLALRDNGAFQDLLDVSWWNGKVSSGQTVASSNSQANTIPANPPEAERQPSQPPSVRSIEPVLPVKVVSPIQSIVSITPVAPPPIPKVEPPQLSIVPPVEIISDPSSLYPAIAPSAKKVMRVEVHTYDPHFMGKVRSKHYNHEDVNTLMNQVVDALNSTNRTLNFQIVRRTVFNSLPKKAGINYTISDSIRCIDWNGNPGRASELRMTENEKKHCAQLADYTQLIPNETLERIKNNEIDEVWLFGAGYDGFGEHSYGVSNKLHSLITSNRPNCINFMSNGPFFGKSPRTFAIMGFNQSSKAELAAHAFGHRIEYMLAVGLGNCSNTFGSTLFNDKVNPGNHFRFLSSSRDDVASCGDVHFPPNMLFGGEEYIYDDVNTVKSTCNGFLTFPSINSQVETIGCGNWGCGHLGYLTWWMKHIPQNEGRDLSGHLESNWWLYLADPDKYIAELPAPNVQAIKQVGSINIVNSSSFVVTGTSTVDIGGHKCILVGNWCFVPR